MLVIERCCSKYRILLLPTAAEMQRRRRVITSTSAGDDTRTHDAHKYLSRSFVPSPVEFLAVAELTCSGRKHGGEGQRGGTARRSGVV